MRAESEPEHETTVEELLDILRCTNNRVTRILVLYALERRAPGFLDRIERLAREAPGIEAR